MLRPSAAPVWRYFFCLDSCCRITRFDLQQHSKTTAYLLSGWNAVQPNLRLIHSLTAPGGLLALRDLSCPLSLHSCHLTRPPNLVSAHVGPPKTPNSMHFSPAKIDSLRLQSFSLRLAPSSSRPDVGKFCVSLQAAHFVCSAGLRLYSLSVAFLQRKSK